MVHIELLTSHKCQYLSNHQQHDRLCNILSKLTTKKTSTLGIISSYWWESTDGRRIFPERGIYADSVLMSRQMYVGSINVGNNTNICEVPRFRRNFEMFNYEALAPRPIWFNVSYSSNCVIFFFKFLNCPPLSQRLSLEKKQNNETRRCSSYTLIITSGVASQKAGVTMRFILLIMNDRFSSVYILLPG